MIVDKHKLKGDDGKYVPFVKTTNMGGALSGGRPRFLVIHYTAGGTAAGASDLSSPASASRAHGRAEWPTHGI